jgi:hypothetical protein
MEELQAAGSSPPDSGSFSHSRPPSLAFVEVIQQRVSLSFRVGLSTAISSIQLTSRPVLLAFRKIRTSQLIA